ncbi:MAG: ABC transporter permease subunit, partial [Planctomycetes bacterium]|nr:ABC transporter permease subunit [Planctomycetota bacterium]
MGKLWSICRNTFLQTIRQPVYLVVVLVTFGLLVFTLPFTGYTMSVDYYQSDQQMLQDLGLGTLRVSSLLVAVFSASGVLRREIEDRTALTVLAKPVSRAVFLLGKYLGVLAAAAVAYYLCSLVFLMTVRHHVVPARSNPVDWPVIVIGFSAFALVVLVAAMGNLWFGWQFTSASVWAGVV